MRWYGVGLIAVVACTQPVVPDPDGGGAQGAALPRWRSWSSREALNYERSDCRSEVNQGAARGGPPAEARAEANSASRRGLALGPVVSTRRPSLVSWRVSTSPFACTLTGSRTLKRWIPPITSLSVVITASSVSSEAPRSASRPSGSNPPGRPNMPEASFNSTGSCSNRAAALLEGTKSDHRPASEPMGLLRKREGG